MEEVMSDQSGSEQRRKPHTVAFRVTDEELAALEAVCTPHESPGQLARRVVFVHAGQEVTVKSYKRQRRRRPGDKELAKMLGQLGKLGENVNRLGRAASAGRDIDPLEVAVMREALEAMRATINSALANG